LVKNATPLSFSQNANQIIRQAKGRTALILNNDILFTPGWLDPLIESGGIASPFSNNQVAYETPALKLRTAMTPEELQGKASELNIIAAEHAKRFTTALPLLVLPFFCIAISAAAQSSIGEFDEKFAPAGGEDFDYCLRAALAGIKVQYAPRSFVLHFGGGSTWAGPEADKSYRTRADAFIEVFLKKWGQPLTELVFNPTMTPFAGRPELARLAEQQRFGDLVRQLSIS
jgi:GT2 family glycosyltransferase